MTDIVLLPDHRASLNALMAFSILLPTPSEFVDVLTEALKESTVDLQMYELATDARPEPDIFLDVSKVFHPQVIASALHYACARAMRPLPDVMVYVGTWLPLAKVMPAPWDGEWEDIRQELGVTPGVTAGEVFDPPEFAESETLPLSGTMVVVEPSAPLPRRLPAPGISMVPAQRLNGRPPLSAFERARVPRRRYFPAPFWWRALITMVDDVFALPAPKIAESQKEVEGYGVLLHVLQRALESAPQELTVGELTDWVAAQQRALRTGGSFPAIEAMLKATGCVDE